MSAAMSSSLLVTVTLSSSHRRANLHIILLGRVKADSKYAYRSQSPNPERQQCYSRITLFNLARIHHVDIDLCVALHASGWWSCQ